MRDVLCELIIIAREMIRGIQVVDWPQRVQEAWAARINVATKVRGLLNSWALFVKSRLLLSTIDQKSRLIFSRCIFPPPRLLVELEYARRLILKQ